MARGQVATRVQGQPAWFVPALAAISLIGAVVRIRAAATEPPHFDESFTALHSVLGSLSDLLTTYDEPNNHIFHSLLAWLSTGLFGGSPLALRLPALLAGIAVVPAVGLLARGVALTELGEGEPDSQRRSAAAVAGLVAAGVVGGAPPMIAYSANARGYSIVCLLLVALLALTLRLGAPAPADGSARPRWRAWGAWAGCAALALWTVPTALFGIGVAAVWLAALRGPSVRGMLPVLGVLAATAAATLALYAPALGDRGFAVDRFVTAPLRALATTTLHAWTAGLAAPLIAAAVLLAAFGAARRPRFGPRAPFAVGLLALPVAIVLLGRMPPYSRTYLFLLIPLATLAGLGAARLVPALGRRGRVAGAGLGVAAAGIALAAAAGAQTREAWGEDPPGPSPGDLVAAVDAAPLPASPGRPPIAIPRFDLPQVQYILTQRGLRGAPAATPARAMAWSSVAPAATVAVLTRAVVPPGEALTNAGLDPAAFAVLSSSVRGDAQVLVVRRR